MKRLLVSCFALILVSITSLSADEKMGVVLMHGKSGTSDSGTPVGVLAEHLEENGLLVIAPDMPWSESRVLDKSFEESMNEIDTHVQALRDRGATKIIVGGHSMGANAALGYGARREGLAGILAIAPGHVPELPGYQAKLDDDWQRAKDMVDTGQGDVVSAFKDKNQGQQTEKDVKAHIYLSWFDPTGPAVMPKNTSRLKPATPLLWIIGQRDRMYDRGEEYAFDSAPSHPANAYVVIKGGHRVTPKKGKDEILEWVKGL